MCVASVLYEVYLPCLFCLLGNVIGLGIAVVVLCPLHILASCVLHVLLCQLHAACLGVLVHTLYWRQSTVRHVLWRTVWTTRL